MKNSQGASPKTAFDAAELITTRFGLPNGFLLALHAEDDWSFTIKLGALLETTVLHCLVARLEQVGLAGHLKRLPHGTRIRIAQSTGSIPAELLPGLAHLAELRNYLVHDIGRITFSLGEYYSRTGNGAKFESLIVFNKDEEVMALPDGTIANYWEVLRENHKLAMIRFAVALLSEAFLSIQEGELESRQRALDKSWADLLVPILMSRRPPTAPIKP